MQTSICPQCNNQFSYYPSMYKKYCSRKCQSDASRVTTNCPECGKEFWYHRSWPRKYCSRECSAAVNGRKNFGKWADGVGLTEVTCDNCNKLFMKPTRDLKKTKHNFCGMACFGIYLAKSLKGVPRPGVRGEKPHLQKRVTKNCPQCGKEFQVKQSHNDRRKFCSRGCMAKWQSESGSVSGESNFNWKGGPLPYYGPNWRQQRRNARARDDYTCRRCGVTEIQLGRQLDVHHKKPFRRFGIKSYKEANSLENLVSLCFTCHKIVENGG